MAWRGVGVGVVETSQPLVLGAGQVGIIELISHKATGRDARVLLLW